MTERRIRLLFVALVLGQLLLITAQVPAADGRGTLLASFWLRAVAPLASAVEAVADGVTSAAVHWTTRRRLLAENERLHRENEALRRQAVTDLGLAGDLERLSGAVDYVRDSGTALRLADVVYLDRHSWMQTMLLRLGPSGARHNQPVITADGLIGRVVEVGGRYGRVQLILDRAASVGAMVERTRRQGIVRGRGSDSLELQLIPLQSDLRVGDRILTAGIDGVYPRGIPVGTVTRAEQGSGLFFEVSLEPAADFGAVDHVYILEPEDLPADLRARGPAAPIEEQP